MKTNVAKAYINGLQQSSCLLCIFICQVCIFSGLFIFLAQYLFKILIAFIASWAILATAIGVPTVASGSGYYDYVIKG